MISSCANFAFTNLRYAEIFMGERKLICVKFFDILSKSEVIMFSNYSYFSPWNHSEDAIINNRHSNKRK